MSKCETCAYSIFPIHNPQIPPDGFGCQRTQSIVKDVRDCPFHIPISELCPLCGKPIPANSGFIPHKMRILVCNSCGELLYSCPTCRHQQECGIANYQGPKPKMVMKEIQAGPIIQRIQVVNPELEAEFCPTCICGGRTNCALLGRCDNYEFILKESEE